MELYYTTLNYTTLHYTNGRLSEIEAGDAEEVRFSSNRGSFEVRSVINLSEWKKRLFCS
jgi:hypothetical protein